VAVTPLIVTVRPTGQTSSPAPSPAPSPPPPPSNARPSASFDFSPGSPETGSQVSFDATASSDSDGTIVSTAWDFDGNQDFADAAGQSAAHVFGVAGTYLVRVRVTDDQGATDTDVHQIVVTDPPPTPNPDRDGDGTPNASDCAPDDPAIHPGAADAPDMSFLDSNCDGVDGDASAAIFVDNENPMAFDGVSAGTRAVPARSIQFGLSRAVATGKKQVYVAGGEYPEGGFSLVPGVSIYGGYEPVSSTLWNRGTGAPAILSGASISGNHARGLVAVNIADTPTAAMKLQLLRIEPGSNTRTRGNVYGLYAQNSPGLTLDHVTIQAGSAGRGSPGSQGADGVAGPNGTNGQNGTCPGLGGGAPGPGGPLNFHGDDISGGAGGAGGSNSNGVTGVDGQPGAAPRGGANGTGGAGGTSAPTPGGDGSAGTAGGAGGPVGGATDAFGSVVAGHWAGASGPTGLDGGNGGGAGGGGGGWAGVNNHGNGGGGGGAGGGQGTGGGGGSAGGGSFGLFVINTSTGPGPTVTNSVIRSDIGGDGGFGAIGGRGAKGGGGGQGATACPGTVGAGGNGGKGGDGGDAGSGGGGAGGVSIAVAGQNVNNFGGIGTSNTLGEGGGGAGGGSFGSGNGTAGVTSAVFSFP
jgi:hypothetical protein